MHVHSKKKEYQYVPRKRKGKLCPNLSYSPTALCLTLTFTEDADVVGNQRLPASVEDGRDRQKSNK
jgi:hypothetical protein